MGAIGDAEVAILGEAALLAVPLYFILQPWLAFRLKGVWRLAALVPLPFAVIAIVWSLTALAEDSNLWPVPFILFAPLAVAYQLVLLVLNLMVRRTDRRI